VEFPPRLQPLDILFALAWVAIVGWSPRTGVIRQLGMLIAVYLAFLLAGSLYQPVGQAAALIFGTSRAPLLEFAAYTILLTGTFAAICWLVRQTYPQGRHRPESGAGQLLGAVIGVIWGLLFLIAVLTALRYFVAVPWPELEATQANVRRQIQQSQVAPMLEMPAWPLWRIMAPWFPSAVDARL
jgi:hypothetical protein